MNIKDIAARAGVSISTVSRVINHTAPVKEEVRQRVEQILEETGYRPSSLAREMQTNRTNLIGVLISVAELDLSSIGPALNAITDELKENGYHLLLANSRFETSEELDFLKVFQEKRVDGVIYFSPGLTATHYSFLEKYPIPIVLVGQESGKKHLPCIVYGNTQAGAEVAEYLYGMGHRHIAMIGGPEHDKALEIRHIGFQDALNKHGLTPHTDQVYHGNFTMESGYAAMKQLWTTSHHKPTAVFAASDFMAVGAMAYLHEQGVRIPEDISIVGFDDVNISAFTHPPLTTVHTNSYGVGTLAAKVVLEVINHKKLPVSRYVVDHQLIERKSVMRIPP